jgi:ComEC/Rec2-related protein
VIGAILGGAFLAGLFFGWITIPLALFAGFLMVMIHPRGMLVASLLLVATVVGALRQPDRADTALRQIEPLNGAVVTVASGVVSDGRMQRFRIRTDSGDIICAETFARTGIGRGDRLSVDMQPDPVDSLPIGFRSYLISQGCAASGTIDGLSILRRGSGPHRWLDHIRADASRRLSTWLPGDRGALLAGLVIGDDAQLSDPAANDFIRTGTYHIVAISGSNLSMLASLLVVFTVWAGRRWREVLPLVAIWAYVLVGGSGPPTIRAGILTTMAAGGRLLGRRADLLMLSIQVAALQALIWPETTAGLSYRLSTAAIVTVLLVAPFAMPRNWPGRIGAVLITSLAVNIALTPLLPEQSRPAIAIAVLANLLIAVPVACAFVLGLFCLAAGLVSPTLAEGIAAIAGQFTEMSLWIVRSLARQSVLPQWTLGPVGRMPHASQWVLAAIVVGTASPLIRRGFGDMHRRLGEQRVLAEPLIAGTAIGALVGVLALLVIR